MAIGSNPLSSTNQTSDITVFSSAIATSIKTVRKNPIPITLWGLIVAAALLIASLPFFMGLTVVVPVLGHATWHLYRKVIVRDPV